MTMIYTYNWYTPMPNKDVHDFELVFRNVSDGMKPIKLQTTMETLGMHPVRFKNVLNHLLSHGVIIKRQQRLYKGI